MMRICDGEFTFVATAKITQERLKLGYKNYQQNCVDYLLDANDPDSIPEITKRIDDADVVILGSAPWSYVDSRAKTGKLVFIYAERIFKAPITAIKAILSGTVTKGFVRPSKYENVKLLCASAFLPADMKLLGLFENRMYRWGYFPPYNEEQVKQKNEPVKLLWVGRLIPWKRPMFPIKLAKVLQKKNIPASIKIIGTGEMEESLKKAITKYGLEKIVTFAGSMPPESVRKEMESADVFLFTSTAHEGWGAVLNEAMNSKCAIIASDHIGSVPFMLRTGENGMTFKTGSFSDFAKQAIKLCTEKDLRERLGENAFLDIKNIWNGTNAAQRLATLVQAVNSGEDSPYAEGPCSKILTHKNDK